jgi:hypothetical protein
VKKAGVEKKNERVQLLLELAVKKYGLRQRLIAEKVMAKKLVVEKSIAAQPLLKKEVSHREEWDQ